MSKKLRGLALVFLVSAPLLSGCYREVRPPRPPHCRYQEWIPGHRDRAGFWIEGHWRCD